MAFPNTIDLNRRPSFRKRCRSLALRTETDSRGCGFTLMDSMATNPSPSGQPRSYSIDSSWMTSKNRSAASHFQNRIRHGIQSEDELTSPRASDRRMAYDPFRIYVRVVAASVSILFLFLPLPASTFSVPLVLPSSFYGTSTLLRLGVSRSSSVVNGTSTESRLDLETTKNIGGTPTAHLDVPRPTANGGFTHTQRSRNKISLANKGKTPWNKGVNRSEEVKAKIAEGVRRRNRQRFLEKLASMNMTEEMWERHQADLQAEKERERLQRQTAQGGYRLSNETRQKISKVLKERYASGQIQRRAVDPDKVRKGFTHSAETRAKIAESLRRRWATDDRYRANMLRQSTSSSAQLETRQKISKSLKEKWQDPEFRELMLTKMAISKGNRSLTSPGSIRYDDDHRQRISEAMKAKWQDESYRAKTLEAIAKKRQTMVTQRESQASLSPQDNHGKATLTLTTKRQTERVSKVSERPVTRLSQSESGSTTSPMEVHVVKPLEPKQAAGPRQRQRSGVTASDHVRSHSVAGSDDTPTKRNASPSAVGLIVPARESAVETTPTMPQSAKSTKKSKKEPRDGAIEKHGSVAKLKQERRDLYDLLYGDDEDDTPIRLDDTDEHQKPRRANKVLHSPKGRSDDEPDELYDFDDENLDRFDPYGLDDF